jgi:hypothetical protein
VEAAVVTRGFFRRWAEYRQLIRFLAFLSFPVVDVQQLRAHDDLAWRMLAAGDASRAEWFEKLRTPSGESCCKASDCRRTEAEWRGDTQGWWANVDGNWRPIPADKVLKAPRTIDGFAYVCIGEGSRGDFKSVSSLPGVIYCFVPPDMGF